MNANETDARNQVIDIGRRMVERGFVAANDGNISVRLDEGSVLTTPTGCSKGKMRADDLPVVNMSGELLSGAKPSTELPLHLYIYSQRPDARAVTHAHPVYATGFATAGLALDRCVLAEIIVTLGSVPLAKYGAPSTEALPRSIEPHIQTSDAFLLANHGVVTVGRDLKDAYFKLERVEHSAHILFIARALGGEKALPKEEVRKLYDLRQTYGIADARNPGCLIDEPDHDPHSCDREDELDAAEFERVVRQVLAAVSGK